LFIIADDLPWSLVCMESSKTLIVLWVKGVSVKKLLDELLEEEEELEERALMLAEAVSLVNSLLKLRAALFSCWYPLVTNLG
jgi:hypothetical protein